MELTIFCDGGARGNPGPAGIGAAVYDSTGELIKTLKKSIGTATNNQAEYQAVIMAMNYAVEHNSAVLKFFLDSELVVRQINGLYRIKNSGLADLAAEVLRLRKNFKSVTFSHIPREKNSLADSLVNQAIDEKVY